MKWPDVEARARRIFGERMLPNLVLLEREEEEFGGVATTANGDNGSDFTERHRKLPKETAAL